MSPKFVANFGGARRISQTSRPSEGLRATLSNAQSAPERLRRTSDARFACPASSGVARRAP
eukprot:3277007-Prymnesium_polylepis.1